MTPPPPTTISPTWAGLVDDAALFPPGNAPLGRAIAAWDARRGEWWAGLVGTFVLKDTDLPQVRGLDAPLSVVATGGAGQVAGPLALAQRLGLQVSGVEVPLRDTDDPAGNARRVVAAIDQARSEGMLAEDTVVHVEMPQGQPTAAWLTAADEVAAADLRLKFRTGGLDPALFPTAAELASWIDAALDRETPFKCTAGLHDAARHRDPETGFEHHGFLNVLLSTAAAFDGAAAADVAAVLEEADETALVERARATDLARARRWFTSFGSCSVTEPLDDLVRLDLVEERA
ncbi:MAG: hypothetical protein AVDCRST_MAG32-1303 [uncultured Nocardioides sp.]|uniref:Uncharacterized protein n=1 Tax=uncultured Nocardioides sp. TaxID=198441 RepID=A0A6J4N7E4_9ACTN|nr:MAG: hypothetical protein AVDCRST_MAG32-1303 [uncultured Nocardioides sp.]